MIEYIKGDMFTSTAQVLVVPVNCVGVAGAGLALQFRKRYPRWYREYCERCFSREIKIGKVDYISLLKPSFEEGPLGVINFPTKEHWRDYSLIVHIEEGLQSLVRLANLRDIKSIALPRLGCGLGRLSWSDVKPLYDMHLAYSRTDYKVYEYERL